MAALTRQFEAALSIIETLRAEGHQALFAGGCVRDLLLGRSLWTTMSPRPPPQNSCSTYSQGRLLWERISASFLWQVSPWTRLRL